MSHGIDLCYRFDMYMHARIYIHTYIRKPSSILNCDRADARVRRCPSNPNGQHRRHRPIINGSRNRTYAPLLKGTRGLSSNINIIDNSIERDELANRDRAAASIHHREDYRTLEAAS